MILGMYGPHAVGKTTFLRGVMDEVVEAINHKSKGTHFPEPVIVLADNNEEYHYNRKNDCWVLSNNKPRWKGKKHEKVPYLHGMVSNKDKLWIIESARYFGGLQHDLLEAYDVCGGGLQFYVPLTDFDTFHKFMQDRCAKANKVFRSDYWTMEKLIYESSGRYINMMNNNYKPAGVKVYTHAIDYERKAWNDIRTVLLSLARKELDWWYT